MKTKKLTLVIALVVLAATSLGQLSFKERLFTRNNVEVAYYTAEYKTEKSKIENWMYDLRSWTSEKVSHEVYEAPERIAKKRNKNFIVCQRSGLISPGYSDQNFFQGFTNNIGSFFTALAFNRHFYLVQMTYNTRISTRNR